MPNWNSSAPWEVIAGPATLYMAPAGTARPSIATYPTIAPTDPWTLIGTNGELNYEEQGVRIASPQEINKWKALGDTGSRKAFRINEDFMVGLKVVDLSLEVWKRALNENTITDTPEAGGDAGHRKAYACAGVGERACRHFGCSLLRDRAEAVERRFGDPEHFGLGLVGIGHEAAVDHRRRTGYVGHHRDDHAAGAGFGRGDEDLSALARHQKAVGQIRELAHAGTSPG